MPILTNIDPSLLKNLIYVAVVIAAIFICAFLLFKKFRRFIVEYIKNHTFFVFVFGIYLTIYLVARIIFYDEIFALLYYEDGIFEYLTSIFFLISSYYFFLTFIKGRNRFNSYLKFVFISLAVFCFFVGMEEISWGQRILNIETPTELKELNYQGETTVHNLVSAEHYTFLYAILSICFLIFFSFKKFSSRNFFGIPVKYMPSTKFLVIAFLLPFIAYYDREHFEAVVSFMFFIYSFQLYKENSHKPALQPLSV